MKENCGHINLGWCMKCVEQLLQHRDRTIQDLDERLQASTPKHSYGIPPFGRGLWFCFYKGNNKWALTDNSENSIVGWNPDITEYFGPIPFEVWDAAKKEEEKNPLQTMIDVLNTKGEIPNFQNCIIQLTKAVMELQDKIKCLK